jgi:glutathione S-transferase
VVELHQAEWCPFSSAVRERLTELGIDFVAKQVAPWPEDRAGGHEIPLLVTEDGKRFEGSEAIFRYLADLEPGRWERDHRERYAEHEGARQRDAPAVLLERNAPLSKG